MGKRTHADSEGSASPSYSPINYITIDDTTPSAEEEVKILKVIPGRSASVLKVVQPVTDTVQTVDEEHTSTDDQEPPELTDRSRSSSRSSKRSTGTSPSGSRSRSRSKSRSNSPSRSRSRSRSMMGSPSRSRTHSRSVTPDCKYPEDCFDDCKECHFGGSRPDSRVARAAIAARSADHDGDFSEEELPEIYYSDADESATEEDNPQMDDHQDSQDSWSDLPVPVPASDPKQAEALSPASLETERQEKELNQRIEKLMVEQTEKEEQKSRENALISLLNTKIKSLRIQTCPGVSIVADIECEELIINIISDN